MDLRGGQGLSFCPFTSGMAWGCMQFVEGLQIDPLMLLILLHWCPLGIQCDGLKELCSFSFWLGTVPYKHLNCGAEMLCRHPMAAFLLNVICALPHANRSVERGRDRKSCSPVWHEGGSFVVLQAPEPHSLDEAKGELMFNVYVAPENLLNLTLIAVRPHSAVWKGKGTS